ncbi:queuosine biosynthesis protein [Rhizobium phage RHph_Y1_1]|nr:queuosine biosynthesis protein [Rhizobium phage RHph_I36]QIG75422.1 queuosine biosynthesis protein [Rhizobium phage RHph_Y1_1]QIG75972.1 queuosine biosynthesis protein [Rhizobium phage RHph_Y2_17_2]
MSQINSNHAMVVLSGGQDSTTCLGWALNNYEKVHCVSFHYGQRHSIELKAAAAVVAHFQAKLDRFIPHEIVMIGANAFAGTSPLTSDADELETYDNHDQMEAIIGDRVEKTFVPMRNAVFLMLAANRAVVAGCGVLVTGVCQADNANYPDCRDVFIRSAEDTINLALGLDRSAYDHFRIATPLMNMSKAESIKFALAHPHTYSALAYSHTAYDGKYPPVGKDHASVLRAHGFEEADVPDPLVLRAVAEELMDLPATPNYSPDMVDWAGDYLPFMGERA